jgi:hypothetical protein
LREITCYIVGNDAPRNPINHRGVTLDENTEGCLITFARTFDEFAVA